MYVYPNVCFHTMPFFNDDQSKYVLIFESATWRGHEIKSNQSLFLKPKCYHLFPPRPFNEPLLTLLRRQVQARKVAEGHGVGCDWRSLSPCPTVKAIFPLFNNMKRHQTKPKPRE